MKKKLCYIIILMIGLLFTSCSSPVGPIEEYLEKLWEIQLNESIWTGFVPTEKYLLYKTQNNPTGKLYKVSKDGKSIQTLHTGGCSYGIPVIKSNIIYTNNCWGTIYAVMETDFSIIWSKSGFEWIPIPVADENYLYVTEENKISALDKANGNTIWATEILGKNAVSPVINGDNLYFATGRLFSDGYLYSINKIDGSINYRKVIPYIAINSQGGGSRAGVEIWNDFIFISGDNRIFYCFEKITGDLVWLFEADAPIQVTPGVSEGYVYFGTLNRTCYALDANTGKVKWSYQGGGSILFEPSFYHNYVMFKASGALLVLDKYSGKELFKMSSSTTEYGFSNAFWDTDGKIYAGGYRESDQQSILIAYQFK